MVERPRWQLGPHVVNGGRLSSLAGLLCGYGAGHLLSTLRDGLLPQKLAAWSGWAAQEPAGGAVVVAIEEGS